MPLLGIVPAAAEMEEAMLAGSPVVKIAGRSRCAEAFRRLAAAAAGFPPASGPARAPVGEEHFQSPAFRELKRRLHRRFIEAERERGGASSFRGNREDARRVLLGLFADEGGPDLTPGFRERLLKELTDSVTGLGPLQDFLDDDGVTEVMVNGPDAIFVERGGKITRVPRSLDGEGELRGIIERIVSPLGRRIDEASPLVDARLADGSRVNAVIPPLALDGSSLTIRKFARRRLTVTDLLRGDNLTPAVAEFLRLSVAGKLNMLISGGTGSGKTTLLNILASHIGADERIVTIEDAAELQLPQEHVVRLESRPANMEGRGAVTIRDLVRNSLRMRPDRIVVGEVRGGEALDMLQAMNTGHEGSMSTLHANSPRDALSRLETMVLMAGLDLPLRAVRDQVSSALDLIVQIARLRDGSRRVVRIVELAGMEGDVYRMQDIFVRRDSEGEIGTLVPAGLVPRIADKLAERGFRPDPAWFA
jgi:pilus assembly protein CpaF